MCIDISKIPVFSYDTITKIVEARVSISYRSTFRMLKFCQKKKNLMFLTNKDNPFHSQLTLGAFSNKARFLQGCGYIKMRLWWTSRQL